MLKHGVMVLACLVVLGLTGAGEVRAQAVDADAKAAAKELIIAMRAADQMRAILPTLLQAIKPVIVQGRPEIERDYDVIQRQIAEAFVADLDGFMEAMAFIYVRHFSAAEMRDLAKFMRGPTGQKFLDKNPVVTQEGMLVGQKFGERAALKMRNKMLDELRKRGHNI